MTTSFGVTSTFCTPLLGEPLVLFACFLSVIPVSAQRGAMNTKDYILVISTYTETFAWSSRLIFTAAESAKDDPHLAIYAEHMDLLMMDNDSTLCEFKTNLFDKYGSHSPRTLLSLGNSTLMLRDDFGRIWGDVPIIFCSERDYIGPKEYYLKKHPAPPPEWIPLTKLVQPYNLVLLYPNQYIRENLELMFHILPDMKKLIYVSNQRFVSQTNSIEIQEVLQSSHPGVQCIFLSPENTLETNRLIGSLNFVNPRTTGILLSSWLYKRKSAGNTSLSIVSLKIASTISPPLFTFGTIDVKDESSGITGGYSYNQTEFDKRLLGIFSDALNGRQPHTLPYYYPLDGMPVINYEALIHKGFSPDLCPTNTYFIDKPHTFRERYSYFFIGTYISTVLFVLFFQYRIRTLNRLKKTQLKGVETMTSYKNLINNMPILYMQEKLITNEQGIGINLICLSVNPHFEQNFFRREDAVGKRASEMFPKSLPEFLHFIQMSLEENRVVTFPYYLRKVNKFYDIVFKGTHQNDMVDTFCLDSIELHLAQQELTATSHKLSMALGVANIIPWKWDLLSETILCDINKPIEFSSPGSNMNGEQLTMLDTWYFSKIFKEDRKRVEQAYKDPIEGRTDEVKEEYWVISVQNHTHKAGWVEAQATVESRDEGGNPTALVSPLLAITKWKEVEMEPTTAKGRAEESNRLKSAFLANMSHEICALLSAIVGSSGILASTNEEEEKWEYVNIVENSNTLLLQLISDILSLLKIEADTFEFQYSSVELNAIVKELEGTLQLKIKPEAVRLEFVSPADRCLVHLEKNRVSRLIINLVTNAIKFAEKRSIRSGYELRGRELYFYVADTGCSIAKDEWESMFGRFVKLNSFVQSTGLGLSICQALVSHMGGHTGVGSEEGKGSTFWFTLPYEAASTAELVRKAVIQSITVEKDKLTILIVEDDESNFRLFESILRQDYRLLHVWDGREAVEVFRKEDPQIILMDTDMPVMDGYETTREIRKYSAKVPVVAVTAFAYASDEQWMMESGFDGYMPKPVNARQLQAQLKEIMQKRIILL